jgi:hypothetical protein
MSLENIVQGCGQARLGARHTVSGTSHSDILLLQATFRADFQDWVDSVSDFPKLASDFPSVIRLPGTMLWT